VFYENCFCCFILYGALRSLLIAQLERIRKEIQDAKDHKQEKERLEEEERKRKKELEQLLRQQAEEKKRLEELQAKRDQEQKMIEKLKKREPCVFGYSWYQVLANYVDRQFISRCVRLAAVGDAREAVISCPMQKQILFERFAGHFTEIAFNCVPYL